MTSAPSSTAVGMAGSCEPRTGCITCGDEGIAMRVIAVADDGLGSCEVPGGSHEVVDLALVDPVVPGDEVLVHAGVALVRLEAGGRP